MLDDANYSTTCPMPGCDGSGHILPIFTQHRSLSGCPHNLQQLKKVNTNRSESPTTDASSSSSGSSRKSNTMQSPQTQMSATGGGGEQPVRPEKPCPLPGCDSTGNTKSLYAFHRSVNRCPLIRIKIEGLKGILTIKQVDDILAGRISLPDWETDPEPTTAEGRKLLEDLRKFVGSSKKAKKQQQQNNNGKQFAGVAERNDENRSPKGESSMAETTVYSTSNGDAYNTRNSSNKKAAAAAVSSFNSTTKSGEDGEEKSEPQPSSLPRFIPSATPANKMFQKYGSAKNKKMAVGKGVKIGNGNVPKLVKPKQTGSLIDKNNAPNTATSPQSEMIFIEPLKNAVKQSKPVVSKVISGKKVIKPVNNENAQSKVVINNSNGSSNGKKRKLSLQSEDSKSCNGKTKQRKEQNNNSNEMSKVSTEEPKPPSPSITFSLLNCDLDNFDLSDEQTRHLQVTYKEAAVKVKRLQDNELALARRLSAAQKEVTDVLRPKKALLASSLHKSMHDFVSICRQIAPLNFEPILSANTGDTDSLVNAYLERIAVISEQRDLDSSLFNLLREQLKEFWQKMQMNHIHSQQRKSPEHNRPQSALSFQGSQ